MLKSLIGKAVGVIDDAGVETVLTLVFVAQFAAYALPVHAADDVWFHVTTESDVVETGTVVQMPAKPNAPRATRAVGARETKGAQKATRTTSAVPARVRRPDPIDEAPGDEQQDLRAAESSVRITIIGPDGQPRTKIVRLSGSRDGMAAPARRPHD